MTQLFYKFAPAILVMINCTLWYIARLLDVHTNINDGLVWLSYLLTQMLISLFCGILIQKLYQGAYVDTLTGLRNRRYFYKKLAHELERVRRAKSPISLALVDIDNFKSINDKYGHISGDKVLKQLASIFQQNTRVIDTVARWGGEEFAVILSETGPEGASVFAERLRKTIEASHFCGKVTVSVGIASTKEEINVERFVALADKALYKAKEKKNLVVIVGNPILAEETC